MRENDLVGRWPGGTNRHLQVVQRPNQFRLTLAAGLFPDASDMRVHGVHAKRVLACVFDGGGSRLQGLGDAGFGLACAGTAGLVWPGTDPLALPRYPVLDWDGAAFAARLPWN